MNFHLVISLLWMIAAVLFFVLIRNRFRSLGKLEPTADGSGQLPEITVIVPARNEEANIEACLLDLLSQNYPGNKLKILIVDDRSQDKTAAIAEQLARVNPQLELLHAPPLPAGWYGKQHACWHAAQHADSEWLCFIDADTRQLPGLITAAVFEATNNKLDLLSLHPQQEMQSYWERLLMPIPFITLMILLDARRINNPSSRTAMANGQFILIRDEVYRAIDGHRSVRAAVLEDVELGKRVKRSGYRIAIRGGGDLIRTRMYRDLPTLWSALARNGSELFGPALTSFAVISAFAAAFFPWFYPLWLSARVEAGSPWQFIAALLAATTGSITWFGLHAYTLRLHNVPLRYLLLIPISDLLIGLVNLDGLLQRVRGRRTWKGRKI